MRGIGERFQTPRAFVEALASLPIPERYAAPAASATPQPQPETAVYGALVPTDGPPLALTAPDLIVGRSDPQRGHRPDIDLIAMDPAQTVSRRHARFVRRGAQFFVEDLNAFNRTRLNGAPLVPHQEAELHSGDIVRLGNVELRFDVRPRSS